jgi:hypothetical protein
MTSNPLLERDAALARGDALWSRLQLHLEEHLHEAADPDGWSGHDVYAHFARWQQVTIDQLRQFLNDERVTPVPGDVDAINQDWHRRDKSLPTDEVRQRCMETRSELRHLLMTLTPVQWERAGKAAGEDVDGGHYLAHLPPDQRSEA